MKFCSFASTIFVGIFLVPFFINNLGIATYGLISLAVVLTQYVGIISNCFSQSITRFITVESHNNKYRANAVFSSAIILYLILIAAQLPLFYYSINNLSFFFEIPEHLLNDAKVFFYCAASAYFLGILGSVFNTSSFIKNRIDISESIEFTRALLRIMLVLTVFSLTTPSIKYVGYIDLLLAAFAFSAKVLSWKLLTPELAFQLSSFSFKAVSSMSVMSGWVLINYLGALFFQRTDIWIANKFISAEAAGQYAALLQWNKLIYAAGGTLSFLISPMVMYYYSKGQYQKLRNTTKVAVKALACFISIPVVVISFYSREILSYWLGPGYVYLWPVLVLLIIHFIINVSITPIFPLQTATNKVKAPAIATFTAGLLSIFISIIAVVYFEGSLLSIAMISALFLTVKNVTFTPWYAARISQSRLFEYYKALFYGMIAAFIVYLISLFTNAILKPYSLRILAVNVIFISILSTSGIWLFLINKQEQRMVIRLLPQNIRKHLKIECLKCANQ